MPGNQIMANYVIRINSLTFLVVYIFHGRAAL